MLKIEFYGFQFFGCRIRFQANLNPKVENHKCRKLDWFVLFVDFVPANAALKWQDGS